MNNTPKLTEADSAKGDSSILNSVMADFNSGRYYIKNHYQNVWDNAFKSYNNIRTKRGYDGAADEFVPETFSIVESLKASIAGAKPKFKYLPTSEDQEVDTTALNALAEFYWQQNNMTRKVLNWVGDMIIYGNGIFYVTWQDDKPLIQHIPLSDFFVDPTATHLNRPEEVGYARYSGHRYLTSIEKLKSKKKVNVETGELESFYKNLDKLSGADTGDETDKDRKEKLIGSTLGKDGQKSQVEVIEYYTRYRHVTIANRNTIILDEKNPYQRAESEVDELLFFDGEVTEYKRKIPEIQGFLPYAILRNYVDDSLFFAKGDVEVIMPTQESLNDTASQKRDNIDYALNNMWGIDPRFKHLAAQIESGPGNIIPIPQGGLYALDKQDVSNSADAEIGRLTQVMRTATAADAAVQGTSQRFSRTTATEVQAQLNQASMRFTTKVQTLEDEGFAQLARIIFKMIQIFVDQPLAVRQIGVKGIEWLTYDPERFTGEYEPVVVLESTAASENAELTQAMQIAAQFSLNNPLVNQQEFLRRMYKTLFSEHLTDDDIEEMLSAQAPVMGPDGQAIDPALTQGNAVMTPGATQALAGEGEFGSFGNTGRGRATQTGMQGGGGADSQSNNIRRSRAAQPSTTLGANSRAV